MANGGGYKTIVSVHYFLYLTLFYESCVRIFARDFYFCLVKKFNVIDIVNTPYLCCCFVSEIAVALKANKIAL